MKIYLKRGEVKMINNIEDLIGYWGFKTDPIELLSKRIYKSTDCGAWIQFQSKDGKWHDDNEVAVIGEVIGFRIGTIVEGSDVNVGPKEFTFPTTENDLREWINEMESDANSFWLEANDYFEDDKDDKGND